MTENETSSFRLGSGPIEETPETTAPDDTRVQFLIKKLRRRSRVTALLLGGMMISMFAWGYWDLQGRFSHQANTGNREIKNISAIFDDRLNELDQKFITIDKKIDENFTKLDKVTIKLQKNMAQLQKNMDAIDLSGTMRKEKKAMLDQMQKAVAPIKADIESLSKDLDAFDQRIRTQLSPLEKQIGQTRDDLARIEKKHKSTAAESINKDDLDLEMLKVKKAYQQQINSEAAAIRKQVRLLTEQMERLKSKISAANRTPPAPAGSTGAVPGGGIQEQNLP